MAGITLPKEGPAAAKERLPSPPSTATAERLDGGNLWDGWPDCTR